MTDGIILLLTVLDQRKHQQERTLVSFSMTFSFIVVYRAYWTNKIFSYTIFSKIFVCGIYWLLYLKWEANKREPALECSLRHSIRTYDACGVSKIWRLTFGDCFSFYFRRSFKQLYSQVLLTRFCWGILTHALNI